jgi:hypothetical protein
MAKNEQIKPTATAASEQHQQHRHRHPHLKTTAMDKQTDVMNWLSQGRIDSKNLARCFPHIRGKVTTRLCCSEHSSTGWNDKEGHV